MVVVDTGKTGLFLQMRGMLGRPNGLGSHWLGWSELGDTNFYSGIYQRRRKGRLTRFDNTSILGLMHFGSNFLGNGKLYSKNRDAGRQIIVKMRHYCGENPRTETQQTWRAVFANGVSEWHSLTTFEKEYYNKLKYPRGQSGFTRFMSKYLAQNYPPA